MKNLTDDSLIKCDKIIDAVAKSYNNTTETVSIKCNDEKGTYKMEYYISHFFYQ